MNLSTSIHDIKTLVLSSHPVIVIETVEEDRVLSLLFSVSAQVRMPLFEWSVTRGLTKAEEPNAFHRMTADPLSLLQHLAGPSVEGIFLIKDFSRYFDNATVVRQFRELTHRLMKKRSTVVLTGETVHLPKRTSGKQSRSPSPWHRSCSGLTRSRGAWLLRGAVRPTLD